ncbi:MAG: glucose-6-phosphate dehydrogenase [Candidatus Doudnabacteria bacterium]
MPNLKKNKQATVLVVFGATGDLMERKLTPAIYYLFKQKNLPPGFSVVGFSRRDWSDEDFRAHLRSSLKKHYPSGLDRKLNKFLQLFTYHQGQLEDPEAYQRLSVRLGRLDRKLKIHSNKLFYLAIPPHFNDNLFHQLSASGLTDKGKLGWTRVLVEKPFGKDLTHAQKLDKLLAKLFSEDQVYRIDHYLAKEVLQNVMAFRFSNHLLEDIWNNKFIEKIEIKLLEQIDVQGRGEFYDGVGALLDVGQNHLLQMLALVTMDDPGAMSGSGIRLKRAEVMENLHILSADEIRTNTLRAQYRGYRKEAGVARSSNTETYFKLKTELEGNRFKGVPIYIESGKNFPENDKQIIVTFKGQGLKNRICFKIQPVAGIVIEFWSKKPGTGMQLEKKTLDFAYEADPSQRYLAEYARLISDAIVGDQTLFVSSREALSAWKFIDPIVNAWQKKLTPLNFYGKNNKILEKFGIDGVPAVAAGPKKLAMIGLGKMGKNLVLQMMEKGYQLTSTNHHSPEAVKELSQNPQFTVTESYGQLLAGLPEQRVVWLMVPHASVDEVLFGKNGLSKHLRRGDIIIDGGNSFYKDSIRRGKFLQKRGIEFLGIGVSGGPGGARRGACLMIGGNRKTYLKLESLFRGISVFGGYKFFPGYGSGHFVKMVHNGIEYGMMQSLAEGFGILKKSPFKLNLVDVAALYNHGSVVESRLVGWLKDAFLMRGQNLRGITGVVGYTGEGEWTAKTAKELKIPAQIIEQSFRFRVKSKKTQSFVGKLVSSMREQFGGHAVK